MRIHGFGAGSIEERERAKTTEPATPAPAAKRGEQDSVVVSSVAREISAAVARQTAARSERVATVRAQVESGSYPIDKDKLAERLADDELARAGRG